MADVIAKYIIGLSSNYGPYVLLAILFIITNFFTEIITNNAAAALAFPLALAVSEQLGGDPTPFFLVIFLAASASFSSPIVYQTTLIVKCLGNYNIMDFFFVGLSPNILFF